MDESPKASIMVEVLEESTLKKGKLISKTNSICPECYKVIPAMIYELDGKVWIAKECSKHGLFRDVYWGSYEMYVRAKRFAHDGKGIENPNTELKDPCPLSCGLCKLHISHTALANIVATNRCDLSCWYCFFYAEKAGYVYEPSIDEIREMIRVLRNERPVPGKAIQLTGGEPALREDIIEVIKVIKEEGIEHIQFNTDGIKMAFDEEFVKKLRESGVNTVYLSFDGVTPKTNPKNHWEVPYVLENCRKVGLGIVLVPTIIKNYNDHEVGEIIRFGIKHIDIVRGVNFQPVSLTGRITKAEVERLRITIPEVIIKIEEQTSGEIPREAWYPVPTPAPLTHLVEALTNKPHYELTAHFSCGMATYIFTDGEKIIPITEFIDVDGLLSFLQEKADELRRGRSKYWMLLELLYGLRKYIDSSKAPKGLKITKILYNIFIKHDYNALSKLHWKSLFLGMMHFMDAYNYDVERVKRCCIHYLTPDKRIIPFCAFNILSSIYRDRIQRKYGIPIEEWERRTGKSIKEDKYVRNVEKLVNSEVYKKTYEGFWP